jgi:hypothetical protein
MKTVRAGVSIGRHGGRSVLLAAVAVLVFGNDARAGAFAIAGLDFRLTFGLASADQSVEPGPPATVCLPIGSGSCGPSGVQANFFLGENFGPTPPGEDLEIRLIDNVFADSPPADFSFYVSAVTGFFSFHNYSDNPVDIELHWQAEYILIAMGDKSRAGIKGVSYEERDVPTRTELIPDTPLFGDDEQSNDGTKDVLLNGLIVVSILAHSTTSLRIQDEISAEARQVVPEPNTLALCLTIVGAAAPFWRARRRSRRSR